MNFLRYEVVDGEERIYVYDNNFPTIETYFYEGSDGEIYEGPFSTFSGPIDRMMYLMDVNEYFNRASSYDATRYVYGDANVISVEGATAYEMCCISENGNYTMFELPEGATEVDIIPLVDNATFRYNGQEFSFGDVDDNTVGKLVLSTGEDDTTTPSDFTVTEKLPEVSLDILAPTTTTIRYKDGIVLHTDVEGTVPTGARIVWSASNNKFKTTDSADGSTLKIVSNSNGYTTFTAKLIDADGNELATDTIEMRSKAGLFDLIGGFFRGLFGLTNIRER